MSYIIRRASCLQFFVSQIIIIILFIIIFSQFQPQVIHKFVYENQSISNNYYNKNFEELIFGDNITGFPQLIVPNIVHYVLFDVQEISFVHFISILSVLKNQKPEIIYIHSNCELSGQYFQRVLEKTVSTQTIIKIRKITKPEIIFDKSLKGKWQNWHSSDITRIRVLSEFGGIYLDRDVYVVKSLDVFRKFEMTLNWDEGLHLGTQVLVAHRNARFLRRWLDTYRVYDKNLWYYNAGDLPTIAVLEKTPELVHRCKGEFGVNGPVVCPKLYNTYYKNWRKEFYTIHLSMRGNSVSNLGWCFQDSYKPAVLTFTEENVKNLKITFAEMCRDVLT